MKKHKFDLYIEDVINSYGINSNKIDQEYFNNCNTLKHDKPIQYKNKFIEIFEKPDNLNNIKYFAYIIDNYGVVEKYLTQLYDDKDTCLFFAKDEIDNDEFISMNKNKIRFRKDEFKYIRRPYLRAINDTKNSHKGVRLMSTQQFSLTPQQAAQFIQLLKENDLTKILEPICADVLAGKYSDDELINEQFVIINISNINDSIQQEVFKTICPYTKLNWFNQIFRESLETVRKN